MRILHLITGLETGGAENALWRLVAAQQGVVESRVVSMIEPGFVGQAMLHEGIDVRHLGMRRGAPSLPALLRFAWQVRSFRPDLVQTWLYHADLLGLVGAGLSGRRGHRPPVAWNLRCSDMDFARYPRSTAWTVALCARLSRRPAAVVANSREAADHHRTLGYRPRRVEVIENGVDCERFAPDEGAAGWLRSGLGLPADALLAGMAGRFDPMKGVPVLLDALAHVPNLHLVLCGAGMDPGNALLAGLVRTRGVQGRVHLLGHRTDLPRIFAGIDFAVSSSLGESFPNVVAEALACGVPAVITEVGAGPRLVGESGFIARPGDVASLAEAMGRMVSLGPSRRRALGAEARSRIMRGWSQAACAERYRALWAELISP